MSDQAENLALRLVAIADELTQLSGESRDLNCVDSVGHYLDAATIDVSRAALVLVGDLKAAEELQLSAGSAGRE